jgi:hypothetical protein
MARPNPRVTTPTTPLPPAADALDDREPIWVIAGESSDHAPEWVPTVRTPRGRQIPARAANV